MTIGSKIVVMGSIMIGDMIAYGSEACELALVGGIAIVF